MTTTVLTDKYNIRETLDQLGIKEINNGACTGTEWLETSGDVLESFSPANGQVIVKITQATWDDYEKVVAKAGETFKTWRKVPAPQRGEIVRQMGEELRNNNIRYLYKKINKWN